MGRYDDDWYDEEYERMCREAEVADDPESVAGWIDRQASWVKWLFWIGVIIAGVGVVLLLFWLRLIFVVIAAYLIYLFFKHFFW